MQEDSKHPNNWRPPLKIEPTENEAHPPELRFVEKNRHNPTKMYIHSLRTNAMQLYDPIMREVLCEALSTIDNRVTVLEERMCFFESSGAILQKQHMNVEELSRYLGYTRCSIYNLTRRKQIPYHKHKRHVFFDKREVDEWIRSCRPAKWDELSVKPESIPIDFNENMKKMRERARPDEIKEDNNNYTKNDNDTRTN